MPDDNDVLSQETRATREARRRRRRRERAGRILAIVAAVVAVALFTLVATDTLGVRGKRPSLTDDVAQAGTPEPAALGLTDSGQIDELEPRRPISPFEPLGLWIAGDSHVGIVGPKLGELVEPTGVVAARVDYRVSSGLLGGPRDWSSYAPAELDEHDPDTVVFMVGTNDAVVWSSDSADRYRLETAAMMDLLSDGGRRVVLWVGTPPLQTSRANAGAIATNEIFRELAAERPEVVYVDAHDLFDDGNGGYTSTITNLDGDEVRARRDDGVHLTDAGAEHLAAVLFSILDNVWDISAQAFPDRPIDWVTTSGSGCGGACGGSSGQGTSSGSSSGSSSAGSTTPSTITDPATPTSTPDDTAAATTTTPGTSVPAPTTTVAPATTVPEASTTSAPGPTVPPTTAAVDEG